MAQLATQPHGPAASPLTPPRGPSPQPAQGPASAPYSLANPSACPAPSLESSRHRHLKPHPPPRRPCRCPPRVLAQKPRITAVHPQTLALACPIKREPPCPARHGAAILVISPSPVRHGAAHGPYRGCTEPRPHVPAAVEPRPQPRRRAGAPRPRRAEPRPRDAVVRTPWPRHASPSPRPRPRAPSHATEPWPRPATSSPLPGTTTSALLPSADVEPRRVRVLYLATPKTSSPEPWQGAAAMPHPNRAGVDSGHSATPTRPRPSRRRTDSRPRRPPPSRTRDLDAVHPGGRAPPRRPRLHEPRRDLRDAVLPVSPSTTVAAATSSSAPTFSPHRCHARLVLAPTVLCRAPVHVFAKGEPPRTKLLPCSPFCHILD